MGGPGRPESRGEWGPGGKGFGDRRKNRMGVFMYQVGRGTGRMWGLQWGGLGKKKHSGRVTGGLIRSGRKSMNGGARLGRKKKKTV